MKHKNKILLSYYHARITCFEIQHKGLYKSLDAIHHKCIVLN